MAGGFFLSPGNTKEAIPTELSQLRQTIQSHRPTLQSAGGEYAILVPLIRRRGALRLLYEVRASTLRHQPGEVCFPGGAMEPSESPLRCALRETEEELGLPSSAVDVVGPLDFLLRGSGVVYPVLALLHADIPGDLHLNPAEVSDVFTVPLTWLRANPPEIYRYTHCPQLADFPYDAVQVPRDYPWSPFVMEVPIYRGLAHPLWGMTARVTARLIRQLYEKEDGQRPSSSLFSPPTPDK